MIHIIENHLPSDCLPLQWRPEFASAEQIYRDFIGRLLNWASRQDAPQLSDNLKAAVHGDHPESLKSNMSFPMSFWPGPLEGAIPPEPVSLPSDMDELLEENLSRRPLANRDLVALVNLSPMFRLHETYLDKAADGIKASIGHLLAEDDDSRSLLQGLAYIAAGHRRADFAELVRSLIQRRSYQSSRDWYGSSLDELQLALLTAAAHQDVEAWASFLSDWVASIAMRIADRDEASQLETATELLCRIEPALRRYIGRANAGLKAFIAA